MQNNILITIMSDNNLEYIKKAILEIQNLDKADLLIIDDGSDYDILDRFWNKKEIEREETNKQNLLESLCFFLLWKK